LKEFIGFKQFVGCFNCRKPITESQYRLTLEVAAKPLHCCWKYG